MKISFKYRLNKKTLLALAAVLLLQTTACERYLDVAPEVEVAEKDVYGDFTRFQGFIEEMYQSLPDLTRSRNRPANWNWSNDVLGRQFQMLVSTFESGDYLKWDTGQYSPFKGFPDQPNDNRVTGNVRRGTWDDGWYGIRLANLAIQNIDLMTGTQEERDLILGQAYFFRGYFHFAIMAAWGGIPYVDKAFSPNDKLDLPRLTYLESAKRVAADLEKAAELLPASWDETVVGKKTLGNNVGRLTKGAAYGFLGKNWLYAASPLMNGSVTGRYTYEPELAKKAAVAFDKLLKLADRGYYGLESWPDYYRNFWGMDGTVPRGKEFVWGNPIYDDSQGAWGEHLLQQLGGNNSSYQPPTLELVNKFGMANGLPIDETDSGYDPKNPFANRDPRFDYSIVVDREKILFYTTAFPADTYAQFYVGGRHRSQVETGFGQKKFLGRGANSRDARWSSNYYFQVPYMRLAHVYLMYAEAVNEGYGGPNGAAPGGITATEAVNIVRRRATVPDLEARFLTGQEKFRLAVRNETGVEMCLESHQWYDYRRWYISHLLENRTKTALNYDKNWTFFEPKLITTIEFDQTKHYWLPFRQGDVSLYKGFDQNPGW